MSTLRRLLIRARGLITERSIVANSIDEKIMEREQQFSSMLHKKSACPIENTDAHAVYDEELSRIRQRIKSDRDRLQLFRNRIYAISSVLTQVDDLYEKLSERADWETCCAAVWETICAERALITLRAKMHLGSDPQSWKELVDLVREATNQLERTKPGSQA